MILIILLFEFSFSIRRFPKNFRFCAATAAYQIEGAATEDGRTPSIWDNFSHIPGKIYNGDNGDVADDHYHLFKEDIDLMRSYGIQTYRFSISPTRILPTPDYTPNQLGIDHYKEELEYLVRSGIEPLLTLFHWDLPQYLDELYGGWLNSTAIVDFFKAYSDVVFKEFGKYVKKWTTFNEPRSFCLNGYQTDIRAPGHTNAPEREPYDCIRSVLLAHAAISKVYREKYRETNNGQITIVLDCNWQEPLTDSINDSYAAQRGFDFYLGVFADPIYFGHFPQSVIDGAQDRLISFTPEEAASIQGSVDAFALNSYTSTYVRDAPELEYGVSYNTDGKFVRTFIALNGTQIGEDAEPDWLKIVPWGIHHLLKYINDRYHPGEILITENGLCVKGEPELPLPDVLHDQGRVNFYKGYLGAVLDAIDEKVPVSTFCAWSLLDNFEWASGLYQRFGITYVDYATQARYPKDSALWFAGLIAGRNFV